VLRRLLLALPILATVTRAVAQEQTPQQFLQSIYDPYRTEGFKGQPYDQPSRFFVPDLAQAIERDVREAKRRKEVPLLDGDPFLDAQDWKITAISYATSVSADKLKAAGAVAFINLGEPKGIALTMIKTPQGWRITDIVSPSGSLRALYKLK
jgi:hypothetical protein